MASPAGLASGIIILGVVVLLILAGGLALFIVMMTRKSDGEDGEGSRSGVGTVVIILCLVGGLLVIMCAGIFGYFTLQRNRYRAREEDAIGARDARERDAAAERRIELVPDPEAAAPDESGGSTQQAIPAE